MNEMKQSVSGRVKGTAVAGGSCQSTRSNFRNPNKAQLPVP